MSEDASITCVEAVSLLKLIVRVEESADPNASRELARRNRLALQQPERRVSAAFGLLVYWKVSPIWSIERSRRFMSTAPRPFFCTSGRNIGFIEINTPGEMI